MFAKFVCGPTVVSKKGGYRQIPTHKGTLQRYIFYAIVFYTILHVTKKIVKKKIIESSHQFLLFCVAYVNGYVLHRIRIFNHSLSIFQQRQNIFPLFLGIFWEIFCFQVQIMFSSFYNNEIIVTPKCWQFNCLKNKCNLQC